MSRTSGLSRDLARLVLCGALLELVACSKADEAPIVQPEPAPVSLEGVSAAPLHGMLAGAPFELGSARYSIDKRPGFEKLELSFSQARSQRPCGERVPLRAASVWLRRAGAEAPEVGSVRLSPAQTLPWQVNYQVHADKEWTGSGDASALVVITSLSPDMRLEGALWACFADAAGSCVNGRFSAEYCRIRLDAPVRGSEAMERLPSKPRGVKP